MSISGGLNPAADDPTTFQERGGRSRWLVGAGGPRRYNDSKLALKWIVTSRLVLLSLSFLYPDRSSEMLSLFNFR